MDKTQVIEALKSHKYFDDRDSYRGGYNDGIEEAISLVRQLDEPAAVDEVDEDWLMAALKKAGVVELPDAGMHIPLFVALQLTRHYLSRQFVDDRKIGCLLHDTLDFRKEKHENVIAIYDAIRPYLRTAPPQTVPAVAVNNSILNLIKDMAIAHDMSHTEFCDTGHWKDEFDCKYKAAIAAIQGQADKKAGA